jgi:hypothetical protein
MDFLKALKRNKVSLTKNSTQVNTNCALIDGLFRGGIPPEKMAMVLGSQGIQHK